MGEPSRPPVFIVGSPRSGTTLTRLIIDSHPNIACGPETHVLADIDDSLERHWPRLERYGPDKEYWHARYRELFGRFMAEYAHSKGKERWADKTPYYAKHLPFITALFPDAQIVHVIRNVEMVVGSALSWGWRNAWNAPVEWVNCVSKAQAFGRQAPPSRYRELRFEDLVNDAEGELRQLFDWLGEGWDPRVLDYDRHAHDGFGSRRNDGSGRNETVSSAARSKDGQAIDAIRAGTPRHRIDPILRARINSVAGRLSRELGYG